MKKIEIPGSYKELPIGKYIKVVAACSEEERDETERTVAVLSILADISEDDVLDLPLDTFMELNARASFLERRPESGKVQDKYTCGAFTLVPTKDMRKVTAAQYIDFQTFCKGGMEKTVEVLSCMLIPEGCRYADGYDILDVQAAIRENMDVQEAFTLYDFFAKSLRQSMLDTVTSSVLASAWTLPKGKRRRALRLAARLKAAVLLGGAGSRAWTRYRRLAAVHGNPSGK